MRSELLDANLSADPHDILATKSSSQKISQGNGRIRYRADIDGLRAIAILPVLFYHAGLGIAPGGYVGVDIFFVISGFLITSILVAEIEKGEYSLVGFYERRIRRIFPALFAMLIPTVVVVAIFFLPADFSEFFKSVLATTLFGSNLFFFSQANYFATAAEIKPLLHTWSLAVEEQYYIVCPLFLYFSITYFRRWTVVLLGLALLVSFAMSCWVVTKKPEAAFFLTPFRAWELVIGSLIVFLPPPRKAGSWLTDVMGGIAICMIVYPIAFYSSGTRFPGASAAMPCVGAAVLIYIGGQRRRATRWLESKALVFVGKISYSLYLWHWPLFAVATYLLFSPTIVERLGLLLAAVLLAILSWRYVETPFRSRRHFTRRSIFVAATTVILVSIGLGAAGDWMAGWRSRFSPDVLAAADVAFSQNDLSCLGRRVQDLASKPLCVIGAPATKPTVVVWGDSHGWAMQNLIEMGLAETGQAAFLITEGGCLPLTGIVRHNYPAPCAELATRTTAFIRENSIKKVVIVANWSGYLDKGLTDALSPRASDEETPKALARRLTATLNDFIKLGVKVVFFDPLPGAPTDAPRAVALARAFGVAMPPALSTAQFLQALRPVFEVADRFGGRIRRVGLWRKLCQTGTCEYVHAGVPLLIDQNHPAKAEFSFAQPDVTSALRD